LKVVFVHLGVEKVDHLWLNLKRTKAMFPNLSIVLVLDDSRHLRKLGRLDVEVFFFSRSSYIGPQLEALDHNIKFRNGFWQFSLERFVALNAWHQEYPQEPFIHFESDILIMPDFPWSKLSSLKKLAWLSFNNTKDVAAIVFSPNSSETKWLANSLCLRLKENPKLTDMTALSVLSQENPHKITMLPTLLVEKIPRDDKSTSKMQDSSMQNSSLFDGLFDGAAIGMWLTGQDPRNHLGWIKRYLSLQDSWVDPSLFNLEISSRGCLTVEYQEMKVPLFNLHVHSKQLSYFGQNWQSKLRKDIMASKDFRNRTSLSLKVTAEIFINYLRINSVFSRKTFKRLKAFLEASRKYRK
jgi:hypothetical protein